MFTMLIWTCVHNFQIWPCQLFVVAQAPSYGFRVNQLRSCPTNGNLDAFGQISPDITTFIQALDSKSIIYLYCAGNPNCKTSIRARE